MPRGPEAAAVDLAEGVRAELERPLRRRGVGQALAQRIRIVLSCAAPGATNLGVARALGVGRPTVATWRRRFAAHRLEGMTDAPRSGEPRRIDDEGRSSVRWPWHSRRCRGTPRTGARARWHAEPA
jgi:hypothetical protein